MSERWRKVEETHAGLALRFLEERARSWRNSAAHRRGEASALRKIPHLAARAEHYERAALNEEAHADACDAAREALEGLR